MLFDIHTCAATESEFGVRSQLVIFLVPILTKTLTVAVVPCYGRQI